MSEACEGIPYNEHQDSPRDYVRELDLAIEQFKRYPDGYEKKYYATIVCAAAVRLRDAQKLAMGG